MQALTISVKKDDKHVLIFIARKKNFYLNKRIGEKKRQKILFFISIFSSQALAKQLSDKHTFFTPDKKVDPCKENIARARLKERSEINVDRIM